MQLTAQPLRATEKHTCFGWCMDLAYWPEDHIPVGTTEICRWSQTSDSVALSIGIIDCDVRHVVLLDLCGQVLIQRVSKRVTRFWRKENPSPYLTHTRKKNTENVQCEFQCDSPSLVFQSPRAEIGTIRANQSRGIPRKNRLFVDGFVFEDSSYGTRCFSRSKRMVSLQYRLLLTWRPHTWIRPRTHSQTDRQCTLEVGCGERQDQRPC